MHIIKHELKQNQVSFWIWTFAIISLLAVCIFLYPQMKDSMGDVGEMFASMGSFSSAFGMDQLNFGSFEGFYAVECGNVLGLGGALFASLIGISMLSKEEKDHTAEFLFTHPISRSKVIINKWIAVCIQIILMNLLIYVISLVCMMIIQVDIPFEEITLLHVAYFILQLQLAAICFGIGAFIVRGAQGIGLGLSLILYFMSLIANISEDMKFLNYLSPFGYAQGSDIIVNCSLETGYLIVGIIIGCICWGIGYYKYKTKDLS